MKGQETPTLTCLLRISSIRQWRLAVSNGPKVHFSTHPLPEDRSNFLSSVVFRYWLDCEGRLDHLLRICSLFLLFLQYEFIPLLNGFRDVRREHHQPTFFKGRPINKMYFYIRNLAYGCYCIAKDGQCR
jgi:hypothetical protein